MPLFAPPLADNCLLHSPRGKLLSPYEMRFYHEKEDRIYSHYNAPQSLWRLSFLITLFAFVYQSSPNLLFLTD
jgi:hypothetical protein